MKTRKKNRKLFWLHWPITHHHRRGAIIAEKTKKRENRHGKLHWMRWKIVAVLRLFCITSHTLKTQSDFSVTTKLFTTQNNFSSLFYRETWNVSIFILSYLSLTRCFSVSECRQRTCTVKFCKPFAEQTQQCLRLNDTNASRRLTSAVCCFFQFFERVRKKSK